MTWNYYMTNATTFVKEYGLMPSLMGRSPFKGAAMPIFIAKLSAIHAAIKEKIEQTAAAAAKRDPTDIVLTGGENG